jgi:hypothetical protein
MNYLIVQLSAKEVIFSVPEKGGTCFIEASRTLSTKTALCLPAAGTRRKAAKEKSSALLPPSSSCASQLPIDRRKVREVSPGDEG